MLKDQHWSKLKYIFRNFRIYPKQNLRNFIEAILYRIRTGCPWRDLPTEFGKSNSIFKLFSNHADKEWIFIDGSYIRAHQHSAGIKNQDISKSIGGNNSKNTFGC